MTKHNPSRRAFVKKAAYAAPAVLSLQAFSAVAKTGSSNDKNRKRAPIKVKKEPKQPPTREKKGR
jgi:hypothetical protein